MSKSLKTYRFCVEGCLDLVSERRSLARSLEGGFPLRAQFGVIFLRVTSSIQV